MTSLEDGAATRVELALLSGRIDALQQHVEAMPSTARGGDDLSAEGAVAADDRTSTQEFERLERRLQ
eukprot:COSAG01_NODE_33987_length_555_cov_1.219298_1_plen_66_part_01